MQCIALVISYAIENAVNDRVFLGACAITLKLLGAVAQQSLPAWQAW